MITPLGWLERVPTYKEQLENIKDKDLHTYGFLGYPLLQSADIVMYGDPRSELIVPVGEDQVAHVELTREIVRRFNFFYGGKLRPELSSKQKMEASEILVRTLPPGHYESSAEGDATILLSHSRSELGLEKYLNLVRRNPRYFTSPDVLREPAAMLTETPRLPGTDGRKMSKSYGNAIELGESDESIRAKTKVMMTDPARKRRQDPGNPDVCPVFSWHKLFSTPETIAWSDQGCRTAGIGCIECKAAMADGLIRWIAPIRARRQEYEANPGQVEEVLRAGSKKAGKTARATMRRVREAIFGSAGTAKAAGSAAAKQMATGS
jgi:tryptophanyl-tRNA synthetase